MKTFLLLTAFAAATTLPALARAQSSGAPLAPVPQVPQTLSVTSEMRASLFANGTVQQINTLFYQVTTARAAGLPARGTQPAVTGAQIDAALGADNVAKLQAAAAALTAAAPSPTP